MLHDRNLTSHTYDEKLADEIYSRIKLYTAIMRNNFDRLIRKSGRLRSVKNLFLMLYVAISSTVATHGLYIGKFP